MDGTLTDTEKYYQEAWPKTMEHFGLKMTSEMALSLRSLGRPFVLDLFKEWYGDDVDYWAIREYRKSQMEDILKDRGIPLKKGCKEILSWCKENGIFVSLVTANDKERAHRYLKQIGLFEYFDAIVCADMVKRGKPAGDIYAYACETLGLSPAETFAVEDSPNGVKSAYAAGCNVIMIPDLTEPDEELKKLLYARLDSLFDLKELCQKE